MNRFIIMKPKAGNQDHHIAVVECKSDYEPTMLRKNDESILILKSWRNVFIGSTPKSPGFHKWREALEIAELIQTSGLESARALYVTGVFNKPHKELVAILKNLKEPSNEESS